MSFFSNRWCLTNIYRHAVNFLFVVHVMWLKGFSSIYLSVLCLLLLHLHLLSLHSHKPLVQGFWTKVLSPPMLATMKTYTHPHSKTAATPRHSGTASTTPTHTDKPIIRTPMESHMHWLGTTTTHILTMALIIQLSHKLTTRTSTQTCSSKIPTFSSSLVLLRAVVSCQQSTSALTHHLKQPSRTTGHRCPPFMSILTHSQLMAIRPSKRAHFHLTAHPIIMLHKPQKI